MTTSLRLCLGVGFLLGAIGSASASNRGSAEDQMACTPDVYRLCANLIPDEDAIVGCLKAHKAVLSTGCAKVFSSPTPGKTQSDDDD